jgi:hypothetical protein
MPQNALAPEFLEREIADFDAHGERNGEEGYQGAAVDEGRRADVEDARARGD